MYAKTMKKNKAIFFGLFLGPSIILNIAWYSFGVQWYKNVVPFFDSLAYQNLSVEIIQTAKDNGYLEGIKHAIDISFNSPLHQIYIAVFSNFLPTNRYILYTYTLPIHLLSILIASFVIYKKTNSFSLALTSWGIYLTTTPFKNLLGGVLDQRLDLVTSSFALIFWSIYLWWEDTPTTKKSVILGVVFGLSVLNRPIFLVQGILFITLTFLYNLIFKKSIKIQSYLKQLILSLSLSAAICFPIIFPKIQNYSRYYFLSNVDTLGGSTLTESLQYNLTAYITSTGSWAIGIILALLLTAIATKTLRWKKLMSVFIGIFSSLLPLIVTRSTGNPYVVYTALSAIALTPLAISTNKSSRFGRYSQHIILIFMFLAIGLNLISLKKNINSISPQNRNNAEETLRELREFSNDKQIYISGFTPVTSGIVSLAQIEHHYFFSLGYTPFHPSQYGLKKDQADNPHNQNEAIDVTLRKIYETGGILMLVDLSNYNNNFGTYSDSIMKQINKKALNSEKLIDTGIALTYNDTIYRFYMIAKQ